MKHADWSHDVLHFWFETLTQKEWFVSTPELDADIAKRFTVLHELLTHYDTLPEDASPNWSLAAIIVLDQFSRNIFRGTAAAFAHDELSCNFCKEALKRNHQLSFNDNEKQFLMMPLMHSENTDDQALSVTLFTELGRPEHAVEHADIFKQFGRFPHRNAVLGRKNTPEEEKYLETGKRFGQ